MNQNYKDVRAAAQMQLSRRVATPGTMLTTEDIHEAIRRAIAMFGCPEEDIDVAMLVAELEASFQTIIGAERVLYGDSDNWERWLAKRKAEVDWRFWSRYEQYLLREKGWPRATLDRLDEVTDRVLDLLCAPDRQGSWDRRGMVVGHVQSGKTSNYVGLIAKAADAGYKLIIVLAGFHKSLRSQTQVRLEEGFLGYDRGAASLNPDAPLVRVGVGMLDPRPKADSITTRADAGDFKRQVANNFAINPGGHPLLFVVKKNGSVLRNLLHWVRWAANAKDEDGKPYVKGVPLLVIDDEADQGSIDTRDGAFDEDGNPDEEHDPTALNSRIRRLLHLFDQSAYVGYTATPFANIFIHEQGRTNRDGEDLFPRSFIVSLPSPSNYTGPSRIFGYIDDNDEVVPGLPIIRRVDDHAESLALFERVGWVPPKHNKNHIPLYEEQDKVPPSLQEAIRSFVLVCAARAVRGAQTAHNSMLVHVTRFTNVQNRVAEQIRSELRDIQRRLRHGDGDSPNQLRAELKALWEEDFEETSIQIAHQGFREDCAFQGWEDIEPGLERAAYSIQIREINGAAGEVLDYMSHEATGLNVIAVGGDKLSRGLTLEGLSVSYFLRASRMYDTLMQMGRWFGYRPRYLDLCRLYTTPEMTNWFSHIASASEELREDFNRMAASGGTPREFGHRVHSHPLMLVTSQVKMRSGTPIDVTFQGDISETINFWRSHSRIERNWQATQQLIHDVESIGIQPIPGPHRTAEAAVFDRSTHQGLWLWQKVTTEAILGFLASYREHEASKKVKTRLLGNYIAEERDKGRLTNWTIALASGRGDPIALGSARTLKVERAWHATDIAEREDLQAQGHYRIRRLLSPTDEAADLTDDEYKRAMAQTLLDWESDGKERKRPTRPGGRQIRAIRPNTRGLLLLYLLESNNDEKVEEDARVLPVVGFGISFPSVHADLATRVRYIVNNVYWTQEVGAPDDGDEG